jgi:hypothetical protein
MAEPPLLISEVLPLTVSLSDFRVLLSPSLPIVRVSRPPLLHALKAHLPILGIAGKPVGVIIASALPLAGRGGADSLIGPVLAELESLLTIAAAPFIHTSVVASLARTLRSAVSVVPTGGV